MGRRRGGFLRWQWEAWRQRRRDPRSPIRFPTVPSDVARPRAAAGELRVTWIGHASVLLQTETANLLLDPVWSRRASPFQWAGPERHAEPGVAIGDLPPLDAILVTHDHYDHLDRPTIEALAARDGRSRGALRTLAAGGHAARDAPLVVTPLGYRDWMLGRGVRKHRELEWWRSAEIVTAGGASRITAVPVRHWTRRTLGERNRRSWCGYAIESAGFRIFFCGDSGYFDGFRAIGARVGALDLAILPIGAYEPRWFMARAHLNPEEAVRAYLALGGRGVCLGVHWGTFVLTDEPLDEPPVRMREAWTAAGLPEDRLWIPRHGETRVLRRLSRPAVSSPSAGSTSAASG